MNLIFHVLFQEKSHAVVIDGYEMVPQNDENALLKAVVNQPVAVAIDASGSDLQFYSQVRNSICLLSVTKKLTFIFKF